jgi:uncharacterized protein YkwD
LNGPLVLALAFGFAIGAQAQPHPAVGELAGALAAARERGCGGQPGVPQSMRPAQRLHDAAQRIARGEPGDLATRRAGYRATRLFVAHLTGYRSAGAVAQTMVQKHCSALLDPALVDVGLHRQGGAYWIVLAAPFSPPPAEAAAAVAERVLELTNEARAQPRTCGTRSFDAAGPVRTNALLQRAAAEHAEDMARHGYFEHESRDGSTPADRVARTGYRWRSVGENLASGQTTPQQVVREWIASPAHCATLMGPQYTEMGVAYSVNIDSPDGIYWTQVFARPR